MKQAMSILAVLALGCGLSISALGIPQSGLSTITYKDAAGQQHIYCFTLSDNYHLVVNYWNGTGWYWADQGLPPGAIDVVSPQAITYLAADGRQRIYVFAEASNQHLVVNYWDGLKWNWADQGLP